ncbi:MAG: sialate O-acetylesterase [Tannerella sp.]|jgi:sialate O-acetylesterase|nr:sialate O-acetylesterase [Tannerella sp.]
MKTKTLFVLLFSALFISGANCEIRLPAVIGDHMTLQQNTKTNLWGWADAGKEVSVRCSWNNNTYTTKAGNDGKWILALNTPSAGGPYEIVISDGKEIKINNVMIGEVWLCSGQSNMEMPVSGVGNGDYVEYAQEFITLACPSRPLRMIQLERRYSVTPLDDCKAEWMTNNPESVGKISAAAYFFADYVQKTLNVPVGIIVTSFGGSNIETWMDEPTLKKTFPDTDFSILKNESEYEKIPFQTPTLLFNAMIMPLKNYAVKGVIWYQGESNIGSYQKYPALQKAMVGLWRELFNNPEMPYYFTQIAPFRYNDVVDNRKSAFLQEAQFRSMNEIENSGMVATVDIGDERSIHPQKKREVGERLAYWALGNTYGLPIKYKSPYYKSMETEEGKIIVYFEECDKGLHNGQGRSASITGFEIAGDDKVFHPAEAKILNNKGASAIEVSHPDVKNPVAVRYCFKNYQPGYLYNNYGLPLVPFRTDNWDK